MRARTHAHTHTRRTHGPATTAGMPRKSTPKRRVSAWVLALFSLVHLLPVLMRPRGLAAGFMGRVWRCFFSGHAICNRIRTTNMPPVTKRGQVDSPPLFFSRPAEQRARPVRVANGVAACGQLRGSTTELSNPSFSVLVTPTLCVVLMTSREPSLTSLHPTTTSTTSTAPPHAGRRQLCRVGRFGRGLGGER
jgi:hypothetical protein